MKQSVVKKQQALETKIAREEQRLKVRAALEEGQKLEGKTFKGKDAARRAKLYGDIIANNPTLPPKDVAMAVRKYFDELGKSGILSLAVGAGLGGAGMKAMGDDE